MPILYNNEPRLRSEPFQSPKRKGHFSENSAPTKKRIEEMSNDHRYEDPQFASLSNMGFTCFLNSVLYALRFAPTFLHNLHHLIADLDLVDSRQSQIKMKTSSLGRNVGSITGPSSRSTSSKDLLSLGSSNDFIPKPKVQIVTEKLHEVYQTMHNLEYKVQNGAHQPTALLEAVRQANSIFQGNNQQDAHEFLVYLLDNLRETCDLLAKHVEHNPNILNDTEITTSSNNSKIWNMRKSWKKRHKSREKAVKEPISEDQNNCTSDIEEACSTDCTANGRQKLGNNFVADYFQGVTLRRTKCLECESVTERKEPFYDIPVPISGKVSSSESSDDLYRKACVTRDKLTESNKYLCEECQRYNEASCDVSFEKLPNIMVLQMKRFTTTATGVQKVTTYMPTPLKLKCFCYSCCSLEEDEMHPHSYRLCCVIMHLGASMAAGHYIAYVKAPDSVEDYFECSRNLPKASLSASNSEKTLNLLKYFKSRTIGSSLQENRNILSKNSLNGNRVCKSLDCCGVRINKNVMENMTNSETSDKKDMWLQCDDDSIKIISRQELEETLAYDENSTATPYLLFYSITDVPVD